MSAALRVIKQQQKQSDTQRPGQTCLLRAFLFVEFGEEFLSMAAYLHGGFASNVLCMIKCTLAYGHGS